MLSSNKRQVNIIAYFTSRFLDKNINGVLEKNVSYKKLGYPSRAETHRSIGEQFGVKSSYVKNVEDNYDSIHSNHRKGWYQRALRLAQQEIVDEFKDKDEEELFELVKSIIKGNTKKAIEVIKSKLEQESWDEAINDNLDDLVQFARVIRKGQPKFRKALLKKYSAKCVITGCDVINVLEAAHILKHSISGINDSSNGLLLRSDIHALFDLNKIRINPDDYTVEIDEELKNSDYWKYQGKKIKSDLNNEYPSKKYLLMKYNV